MKNIIIGTVLTSITAAHSGVWKINADGNTYPTFDERMDGKLGAKRVEWTFRSNGVPWAPITNVDSPGFTCGMDAKAPALKVKARAGAKVTVEWSGVVRTHYGPIMNYLAYMPTPDAKPQSLSFFKIDHKGWNPATKKWANEVLVADNYKDTFQLPSDIKPGTYVLRTELLALHFASTQGPQFYPHCINIEISGSGTASPPGVKFPGAYKKGEPSIVFKLFNGNQQTDWTKYTIPGPPKYNGEYVLPTGPGPVVSDQEKGIFPKEFQDKYDALKKKEDAEALEFNEKINKAQGVSNTKPASEATLGRPFQEHFAAQRKFDQEAQQLRAEAIKLGIAV